MYKNFEILVKHKLKKTNLIFIIALDLNNYKKKKNI